MSNLESEPDMDISPLHRLTNEESFEINRRRSPQEFEKDLQKQNMERAKKVIGIGLNDLGKMEEGSGDFLGKLQEIRNSAIFGSGSWRDGELEKRWTPEATNKESKEKENFYISQLNQQFLHLDENSREKIHSNIAREASNAISIKVQALDTRLGTIDLGTELEIRNNLFRRTAGILTPEEVNDIVKKEIENAAAIKKQRIAQDMLRMGGSTPPTTTPPEKPDTTAEEKEKARRIAQLNRLKPIVEERERDLATRAREIERDAKIEPNANLVEESKRPEKAPLDKKAEEYVKQVLEGSSEENKDTMGKWIADRKNETGGDATKSLSDEFIRYLENRFSKEFDGNTFRSNAQLEVWKLAKKWAEANGGGISDEGINGLADSLVSIIEGNRK